ncbi:MAG TPA: SCO family protein [Kofleriaceae bacterium]|nr:SCO family protein [Kofleriaceae bacterium]
MTAAGRDALRIQGPKLLLGLLGIVVVVALVIFIPSFVCRPADKPLPDLATIEDFTLVDEMGRPFTDDALHGHVTIVDFIFTRCDTICPINTMKMERIQAKTEDVAKQIKLVSFSVDPTYDTPAKLLEYATKYRYEPDRWRFVTGDMKTVNDTIERQFMTSMMRLPDKPNGIPDISHQGYFLLLDKNAHLRGIYDSDRINQLDELLHDARQLARTQKQP